MRKVLLLLVGLLALAGCGSSTQRVAYMPTTCTASPPFHQHPAAFAFSCDGNRAVSDVHWNSWGDGIATGSATMLVAGPCNPSCSTAATYRYPVRVVATDLATCSDAGGSSVRVYGLVTAYLPKVNAAGIPSQSLRLQSCQTS